MELFSDFKFWLFAFTLVNGLIQWYIATKVTKFEVDKLKEDFQHFETMYENDKKERTDLLIQMAKDIAHMKGQMESDSKIIKLLDKVINK